MTTVALVFLVLFIAPTTALCGDYMLTISDDPDAQCAEALQARRIHDWCQGEIAKGNVCLSDISWPVHTTDEVIESIDLYFAGQKPKIEILLASFSNGHLTFCARAERCKIFNHLQKLKASGTLTNARHLNDFIGILPVKGDQCLHNQAL